MATLFYYPQSVDYDDYPKGSPGPSFASLEEAISYIADHTYYNSLQYSYLWESNQEYTDYMNGTYDPPRPDPRVHVWKTEFFTRDLKTGKLVSKVVSQDQTS